MPVVSGPVYPDCQSLGNARQDLAELHPERSPGWSPPGPPMSSPQGYYIQSAYQSAIPHTLKRQYEKQGGKVLKWQK